MLENSKRLLGLSYNEQVDFLRSEQEKNGKDCRYNVYGDEAIWYALHFEGVLDGINLYQFVGSKKNPVVLDLLGPSDTIADLFENSQASNCLGIAVSLEDKRNFSQKKRDRNLNIVQIAGDITDSTTCAHIDRLLNGKRVDLGMERGLRGLEHIPIDLDFYLKALNRCWNLLNTDGMFLIQTLPQSELEYFKIDLPNIISNIQQKGIDITYSMETSQCPYGAIRMIKHDNSPIYL